MHGSKWGIADDVENVSEDFFATLDELPFGPDRIIQVGLKFSEIGKGPRQLFSIENGKLVLTRNSVIATGLETALMKFSYYQDEIQKSECATSIE